MPSMCGRPYRCCGKAAACPGETWMHKKSPVIHGAWNQTRQPVASTCLIRTVPSNRGRFDDTWDASRNAVRIACPVTHGCHDQCGTDRVPAEVDTVGRQSVNHARYRQPHPIALRAGGRRRLPVPTIPICHRRIAATTVVLPVTGSAVSRAGLLTLGRVITRDGGMLPSGSHSTGLQSRAASIRVT